ncbi:MAG: Glu/Leu/Phe/Val dehydrogenase dimerization domain-containing protein [Saprospiraceae bacterium]
MKNSEDLQFFLDTYKSTPPEIVFEWNDPETDAKGWVVINSLKGGAAGGGTRMRKGLTKEEVMSLAKVMEIKFSVCGPSIGGAKSGIDFDPSDPRRTEVLKRWYKAVFPLLKNYYGTGGDMNVDELKDVIPITEDLGLWHPQEGIVNGHFNSSDGEKINAIGQLRYGCAKIIEDPTYAPIDSEKYAVADMITGYGVSESIRHYYDLWNDGDLKGKKVLIQGWGNVASAAGYYLASHGCKVVGILDRVGGIIRPEGLSFEEVKSLFVNKDGNKLSGNLMSFEEANDLFWDQEADIFMPGAASKLVTKDQVGRLIKKGLEVISCGANDPFIDNALFFGDNAAFIDSSLSVIPDFVANCGMARVFAYLMQPEAEMTDGAIFNDVSETINEFLKKIRQIDDSKLDITRKSLINSLKLKNSLL